MNRFPKDKHQWRRIGTPLPGVALTQGIWCFAVYAGSVFLNRFLTQPVSPRKVKGRPRFRKHVIAVLSGLVAILAADQLSPDTPLWPAVTFLTLSGGMMFPFRKEWRARIPGSYYGFSCYWGGLFYLDPWLSLVVLVLATEVYFITRDRLAGVLLLVSPVPFLFSYARWNAGFIWAAAGIVAITVVHFYPEFRQRWRDIWKPGPGEVKL